MKRVLVDPLVLISESRRTFLVWSMGRSRTVLGDQSDDELGDLPAEDKWMRENPDGVVAIWSEWNVEGSA